MTGILQPGDLFLDKYRIERLVGKGGMGAVYAAVDMDLSRRVAVKLLLPHVAAVPQAVTRFINEGRAAARIEGEHVARVFAAGRTPDGLAYMVLELLEGVDLSSFLRQHPRMPVGQAADYVLQALEAVAEAHHHGIVHRDLKPGNLFLARRTNGTEVVKVLDFGISKVNDPLTEQDHALTSTRAMLGSPLYMSPEQLRSAKSVDRRSDIWSIGVMLYEMLTGALPFRGESMGELFAAILEQDPIPLGQHRPDVPHELQATVAACLQRDPQRRIANAYQLACALAPFAVRSRDSVEHIRGFFDVPAAATAPLAEGPSIPPPPHAPHGQTAQAWADSRANASASTMGNTQPRQGRSLLAYLLIIPVAFVVAGSIVAIFLASRTKIPPAAPPVLASPVSSPAPPPETAHPVLTAEPARPTEEAGLSPSASAAAIADAGTKPPRRPHSAASASPSSTAAPSVTGAPEFDPTKATRF
ncbi:serine/threonine protein kinase [Pendulispora rubella]|uniref:Serine/threonine protein kinase n=1 Tax=Pendulispora rubella TaxID=2741070 RepID=A0ABZ2KWR2_9BACT